MFRIIYKIKIAVLILGTVFLALPFLAQAQNGVSLTGIVTLNLNTLQAVPTAVIAGIPPGQQITNLVVGSNYLDITLDNLSDITFNTTVAGQYLKLTPASGATFTVTPACPTTTAAISGTGATVVVRLEVTSVNSCPPAPPPPPPAAPSGGGTVNPVPSVIFEGRAFPLSKVVVLKNGEIAVSTVAGPDANFQVNLYGLATGNYIFDIYGEDSTGLRSSSFTFPSVFITTGSTTRLSGIYIAPTIAVDKSTVKKGDNIAIFGQSVPSSEITITVNSDQEYLSKVKADTTGVYLYNFDTSPLNLGQHSTASKSATNGAISTFSNAVSFTVGSQNIPASPQTSGTTLNPGDLIKATTATVYYYGSDGKRHAFPNQGTYDSWYNGDFSKVKKITAAQLSGITLGYNMTYKPGVRMLKLQSTPSVYAVAENATLRLITSEQIAQALYGVNWNKFIADLSDAFFINYTVGAPINQASDFPADLLPAPGTPGPALPKAQCQLAVALTQDLVKGSSGSQVLAMQNLLKCLGYFPASVVANGYFGQATSDAVVKFQKANNLLAQGRVGAETRNLLNNYLPAKSNQVTAPSKCHSTVILTQDLVMGSSGPQVLALQNQLKCLGYFPADVTANSYFGQATHDAVVKFQKANNLLAQGRVGSQTRALLNKY